MISFRWRFFGMSKYFGMIERKSKKTFQKTKAANKCHSKNNMNCFSDLYFAECKLNKEKTNKKENNFVLRIA